MTLRQIKKKKKIVGSIFLVREYLNIIDHVDISLFRVKVYIFSSAGGSWCQQSGNNPYSASNLYYWYLFANNIGIATNI